MYRTPVSRWCGSFGSKLERWECSACAAQIERFLEGRLSTPETRLRVGDVRSPALLPVLVALSAVVFVVVLYLTRYKNFYYDEWDYVSQYRPSQSTSIWLPHNEHWSTLPILLWKLL